MPPEDPDATAAFDRKATSPGPPASSAAPEPAPLGRISRFALQKEIGRGGFGVVYRATDSILGRTVALKVLNASKSDKDGIARFVLEASSAAKLRHPNIVAVHDSGRVADGRCFIASEFVRGRALSRFTDEARRAEGKPPLDRETKVRWVRDLALALAYAHSEGVVHRDVKPDNILIDASQLRPQLTDFGLAKRLDVEMPTLTQTGMIVGTPSYMSPEQARGEGDLVGPASDQYSLGVVLFELLAGSRLYQGDALQIIRRLADQDESPQLRAVAPEAPKDLAAICSKAMEKLPQDRYPDLAALADDLTRWLEGRTVSARPISLPAKALRWSRRNPVAAGLIGAVVLVTAIGFTSVSLALGQAVVAERRADKNADKAVDEAAKATAALRVAQAANYRSSVQEALRNAETGNIDEARTLLDGCPDKLRQWEWRYVDAKLRSLANVVQFGERGSEVFEYLGDGHEILVLDKFSGAGDVYRSQDGSHVRGFPALFQKESPTDLAKIDSVNVAAGGHKALITASHSITRPSPGTFARTSEGFLVDLKTMRSTSLDFTNARNSAPLASADLATASMWLSSQGVAFGRERATPQPIEMRLSSSGVAKFAEAEVSQGRAMPIRTSDGANPYVVTIRTEDDAHYVALLRAQGAAFESVFEYPHPFFGRIEAACFHEGTSRLYLGDENGNLHILRTSSLPPEPDAVSSETRRPFSSPDPPALRRDGNQAGYVRMISSAHAAKLKEIAISQSGELAATIGDDHMLKLWNTRSGTVRFARGFADSLRSVRVAPDGGSVTCTVMSDSTFESVTMSIRVPESARAWLTDDPMLGYAYHNGDHAFTAGFSVNKSLYVKGADGVSESISVPGGFGMFGAVKRGFEEQEGYLGLDNSVMELDRRRIVSPVIGSGSWLIGYSAFNGHYVILPRIIPLAARNDSEFPLLCDDEGRTIAEFREAGPSSFNADCLERHRAWVISCNEIDPTKDEIGELPLFLKYFSEEGGELIGGIALDEMGISSVVSPDESLIANLAISRVNVFQVRPDEHLSHSGALVSSLEGHAGAVIDAAFLDGNSRIATCGLDGSVRVWNVETGEEMLTLKKFDVEIVGLSAGDDGQSVYVGTADGMCEHFSAMSE